MQILITFVMHLKEAYCKNHMEVYSHTSVSLRHVCINVLMRLEAQAIRLNGVYISIHITQHPGFLHSVNLDMKKHFSGHFQKILGITFF